MRARTLIRSALTAPAIVLAAIALTAATPAAATVVVVSGVPVDVDSTGRSAPAPDVGKLGVTAMPNGSRRTISAGTWLNRSNLPAGEWINWHIDTKPGGQPMYGGDLLVALFGNAKRPDTWATYRWDGTAWRTSELAGFRTLAVPDGRVLWQFDLPSGGSTPAAPASIGVRAVTGHRGGDGVTYVDRSPDATAPNVTLSLEAANGYDPLPGCTYDGDCLGAAPSTDDPFEGVPYHACGEARSALANVRTQLRRARAAHRRAHGASRRRLARSVRRLERRRSDRAAAVRELC